MCTAGHVARDQQRLLDASIRPSGAADPLSPAARRGMALSASAGAVHDLGALRFEFVVLITEGDS